MDRKVIIENVARESLLGVKNILPWEELSPVAREAVFMDTEQTLKAAGYFELLEQQEQAKAQGAREERERIIKLLVESESCANHGDENIDCVLVGCEECWMQKLQESTL